MYTGSDEDILGLPEPELKLLTQLYHRSTATQDKYISTGFQSSVIREKKKDEIAIELFKNERNEQHKKPSSLF